MMMNDSVLARVAALKKMPTAELKQQWQQARTNFTAKDRADMQQLRAMFQMLRSASLQLELENNYIRFQARLAPMWR